MSAQVAADLRAAAEVLRRDGWTQDVFHRLADESRICHCAEGAIQLVVGRHFDVQRDERCDAGVDWQLSYDEAVDRRYDEAEAALSAEVGASQLGGIPAWNDTPGRTADEVIAALEAAADAADPPPCIRDASCEIGDHTRSWPCDYAPGTGSLAGEDDQ